MTGYPTVLLDGPPRATSFYLVRSESPNEIMNGNAQGGYFGLRLQDTQVEIMQVTPGLWPRVKSAPNVNTRKGVCETITVDSTGRLQDGRYWVVNGYASLPYGSMWCRIRPKENALFHEIAHRVARTARRTNDGRLVKS